jgi:hypothetical protein
VKFGIREYKLHRDNAFRRAGGLIDVKCSTTVLPADSSTVCPVRLIFKIHHYGQDDGFLFMSCGYGNSHHQHHLKPNNGDLPAMKRHVPPATQRLIHDGGKASTGSSALRYLVLKNQNMFVQRTTLRSIQLDPTFLLAGAPNPTGQSTASRLVNWLRKQSKDEQLGIRYTVLFHKLMGGHQFHKFPKGRPSKDWVPISEVNNSMQIVLSQTEDCEVQFKRNDDEPATDYLESLHFSGLSLEEEYVKSPLPSDGIYGKDILSEDAMNQRQIMKDFGIDATRILLGAAWVDEDNWREFLRYPECLFVDSTHGTNNESRPLLQLVGRDSDGKGFTICRIFMPNETASFYRWVFLEALPLLLGAVNLGRIVLILSDGDSQEFNAIDEGIYKHFKNARRGRCAYHIVQKTWESAFPSSTCFTQPDNADSLTIAIKRWIYTWMDGSSCGTCDQYNFSRDLLMHILETNEDFHQILGAHACQQIRNWLNSKVFPLEDFICFYPKKHLRCFDDYMNNVVEGMNLAAKKSDMSAKPKHNMDKAADSMQNHSNLKSRTRKCNLARNLNSVPLYIAPGYGHNTQCLSKLRETACHMIIQQYRGMFHTLIEGHDSTPFPLNCISVRENQLCSPAGNT